MIGIHQARHTCQYYYLIDDAALLGFLRHLRAVRFLSSLAASILVTPFALKTRRVAIVTNIPRSVFVHLAGVDVDITAQAFNTPQARHPPAAAHVCAWRL